VKVLVCVKTLAGAAVSPAEAFERGGRVGPTVLCAARHVSSS